MRRLFLAVLLAVIVPVAARGQSNATSLTVDRIFAGRDFQSAPLPSIHWLADGRSYLGTRSNPAGGEDLVRVDLVTGQTTTLVDAAVIVGADGKRLSIENIELSDDETKALLFHS